MSGVSTELSIVGHRDLVDGFARILAAARAQQAAGDQKFITSVARYAIFLEYGTTKMHSRPHWRVAPQIVIDRIAFDTKLQQELLNIMVNGGSMNGHVAQEIFEELRRMVRLQMYLTGNYYGSIAIGDSPADAVANSEAKLIDPSTSALLSQ